MRWKRQVTRRQFGYRLGGAAGTLSAAGAGVSLATSLLRAADAPTTISLDPSLVDDWLTPNELFFIREHFPAPEISASEWKLSFTGAVAQPFEMDYRELLRFPRRDLPVTIECAGNPPGGGLVSNAEWNGTRLAALLDRAQPTEGAKYVRLKGADGVAARNEFYARAIPIEKARHADTLLAYGMNGEKLPVSHGFPVRAVIPGWYGMDSVKWLREIEVLTEEDTSPLMTARYRRETRAADGSGQSERITSMRVKAAFSRPLEGAVLVGRTMLLRGVAWAGERAVGRVEISVDGGKMWADAELIADGGRPRPYAWVAWKHEWTGIEPGQHELLVRATDDEGATQPERRADDRLDPNELNHYQRVRCVVV